MIRLIVEIVDAEDHVNIDAPVRKVYRTVDIQNAPLEQLLRGSRALLTATLVGAEIL